MISLIVEMNDAGSFDVFTEDGVLVGHMTEEEHREFRDEV